MVNEADPEGLSKYEIALILKVFDLAARRGAFFVEEFLEIGELCKKLRLLENADRRSTSLAASNIGPSV